jgi:tetratricopeptide (TPR) repeat protein
VPSLVAADAVALFHERAGQRDDDAAVAQICQRLDGIPLAIELAAARTRVLSVAQIAARLDDRFRLLTDGSRSALPRHRTLKAAVDWGYQLLTDEEQALLCRLSVFAGGCTLEAAEAVAGRDVLDPLANLVDKSLVVFSGRYRLLETVRQYAAERLSERGETDDARARHLAYFVALAEAAEPHIFGGDSDRGWIDRLDEENDNLRAALDLCEADERRAEPALRLAAGLHWFWFARGHLREAHVRITGALRRRALAPARVRVRALTAAGSLAMWVGDYAAMSGLLTEGLALARELGDLQLTAYALAGLGAAGVNAGDTAAALPLLVEAAALARVHAADVFLVFVLYWLGTAEHVHGDLPAARAALDEGLALARRLANRPGIGHTLFRLGEVAESAADHEEARRHYLDSLRTLEESADRWGMVQVLDALGRLSIVAGVAGRPDHGARLSGAVEALCELTGAQILASERRRVAVATVRSVLGEPAFAAAWAEGRALRLEQAVALARTA